VDEIYGAQVGVINAGLDVHGGQIGVINVARSVDYYNLGLVNIITTGQTHLNFWADDLGFVNAGIKHGTRRFYNHYFFGSNGGFKQMLAGLGYGVYLYDSGMLELSLELIARALFKENEVFAEPPALLGSGRFALGWKIISPLTLVGTVSYNYFNNFDNTSITIPTPRYLKLSGSGEDEMHWLGWSLGFQVRIF
jgi:hypothetical protein